MFLDMDLILEKEQNLRKYIRELGSLAVAFSSGVDSTYLLKIAKDELGDKVIALTAQSCIFPQRESKEAINFCRDLGIRQIIVEPNELEIEGFVQNPPNRCYLCKKDLFERFLQVAEEEGMNAVAEGSNMDDLGDYRPGLQAVAELNIESPLRYAKLYKKEIRVLSKRLNLPTWEKQSFACLSSRFPYGELITREKLKMVEQSEELLKSMGFLQFRVRIHGDMARIEILPEQFSLIMKPESREKIVKALKDFGFSYVSLDLQGFRSGSMNEVLKE